jgi:hypothetical protein
VVTLEIQGTDRVIAFVSSTERRVTDALRRAVAIATIDLSNYVKTNKLSGQVLNVKTGTLRRAVKSYPPSGDGPIVGTVSVGQEAAVYGRVHEYGGAGPYEITPIRAKALRFMLGGQAVFAKSVMHPPAKERSFMRSALADKRAEIIARLERAVSSAFSGQAGA